MNRPELPAIVQIVEDCLWPDGVGGIQEAWVILAGFGHVCKLRGEVTYRLVEFFRIAGLK